MIDTVLLNGLWQGALIAAIAALTTLLVPQRHAATRYAVWFSALLALAILPIASLWHPAPAFATLPNPIAHTSAATSLVTAKAASASGSWLMLVWLAGVAFCLVRLALSYARINRIVRDATPAPDLGTRVMTSDAIVIPIAARFFAPLVIIPTRLVATLERGDLEAIVRHERAHIRRMDVLGNFIQRLVEACLFFNPWAYLIGRQLIKERESACDDWAVHASGEPDRYASCLAQLAHGANGSRAPMLTPSAIGSRRMLVGRIARLLNGKVTQLKVNYFVLGASVLMFVILAFALQTPNGLASISKAVAVSNPTACVHSGADVKVRSAAMPDIPKEMYRPNVSAYALVTVGPDGHPVKARIVTSSGSAGIDRATVNAAMASTYSPEINLCKAVTGQYLFHVATGPPQP
jgi:beta-lactamase regulating signal transducer with metallopeptidase domain